MATLYVVCLRNVVSSIILMIISGAKAMAHYYYLYKKPESSGMVSVRVGIWASFFGNKRVDQFLIYCREGGIFGQLLLEITP